ncbi:MAG: glutamate-5-semialdehyde dehydrogenase [Actinobacteria bacterium]|nr:glutamate-5-semialdehyde dehydrogenase [Actinomycetota bacterium]
MAARARRAGKALAASSYQDRQRLLNAIADRIDGGIAAIVAKNEEDVTREREAGMNESLLDRLTLNPSRVRAIASATRKVATLADPLGQAKISRRLENGLQLDQVTVPFGVVGMIYEARPNVTVDAAVILLMSGNASLLRGSSSAHLSNKYLVDLMRDVIAKEGFDPELIQLIPSSDRDSVRELLHARGDVDLVIPRGSAALIRMVVDEALVPTIETGAGVCHIFFDFSADAKKALPILVNAKTNRPSVCNAVETLLVHRSRKDDLLPDALRELTSHKVKLHCDERSLQVARSLGIEAHPASDENFHTEYGRLEINIAVVDDLDAAIAHIDRFGTKHTEAIITEDADEAKRFVSMIDAAAVMINASTRFTDGEEMGFGAEIGISNQKLHARGPMGLEAMTTTTWVVSGNGQVRS